MYCITMGHLKLASIKNKINLSLLNTIYTRNSCSCLVGAASQVGAVLAPYFVVGGGAGAIGSWSSATGKGWFVSRTVLGRYVKLFHYTVSCSDWWVSWL